MQQNKWDKHFITFYMYIFWEAIKKHRKKYDGSWQEKEEEERYVNSFDDEIFKNSKLKY